MPLNLPDAQEVVLRHPPLKKVIAQIRFATILSIREENFIAPFQEDIREEYPILEREELVEFQIAQSGVTPPVQSAVWRFLNPERNWSAVLAPDFLGLEAHAYREFDDFAARFQHLLQALERFRPSQQTRLGLRYVNSFEHPERATAKDWQGLLRDELLGALASGVFDGVERATQRIQVRQDDGWFILRLSLLPGAPDGGAQIVLDFDYYDETQRQLDNALVMDKLRKFNEVIYRMFRWAVLEPLLKEFEPENADA